MAIEERVLIAGAGPVGLTAAANLVRAGVPVTVLEKHKDFLRDFRGDTIHPSTLEVLRELGILEQFLARPHQEVRYAEGELGDTRVRLADFTHLPTHCKFVAFMPQWDFLDFLADQARALPAFTLRMETEALRVVRVADRVSGVEVRSVSGEERLPARLVIAADRRESAVNGFCRKSVAALLMPRRSISLSVYPDMNSTRTPGLSSCSSSTIPRPPSVGISTSVNTRSISPTCSAAIRRAMAPSDASSTL
jgi:2-polyprenyl-6-methoxyphenol hydroxylase-like FAD-dependent oxidoreductase